MTQLARDRESIEGVEVDEGSFAQTQPRSPRTIRCRYPDPRQGTRGTGWTHRLERSFGNAGDVFRAAVDHDGS